MSVRWLIYWGVRVACILAAVCILIVAGCASIFITELEHADYY